MSTLNEHSGKEFIGRLYKVGREVPLILGDTVIVHPTGYSQMRESYKAKIIIGKMGLSTTMPGGHDCAMWDGLFNRLELFSRA